MRYTLYCLMLGGLLLIACKGDSEVAEKTSTQEEAVAVMVESVRQERFSDEFKITGEIEPLWEVDVYSKAAGKVTAEYIRLGQRVQEGQALAEVLQDIPGMEFAPVKIEASASGIITQDRVEIGSMVSPPMPVYRISALQRVFVVAQVFESMLNMVKPGDPVRLQVEVPGNKPLTGRVAEISPVADPVSRTIDVKILVDNPSYHLKPGMFVVCYFRARPRTGLLAPLDAIVRSGANKYVYVLQGDRVRFTAVETGVILDRSIEVVSGLESGDRVVVVGQNQLQDGAPVQIIEER
ncbi:efflux RND transporter periplasmic adaptor subunit [candidate division KSB1 bacterium]|nr:efflux RND transporter periplasmic adaptor subunit [candidate division KSB1 bacterium]